MWIDDDILAQADHSLSIATWVPADPMVVLGRSNKLEEEVNVTWCRDQNIRLLQRYGGGGTVVLYPGCLIITVGAWVQKAFHNDLYFEKLNQAVANTLTQYESEIILGQDGVSDLTLGDKKVAGTSLFRSGPYLLYQASLICELDIGLIERALGHPTKEPDYRKGRAHKDFLTDLGAWQVKPEELKRHFDLYFMTEVINQLGDEEAEPEAKYLKNLRARMQRGLNGEGELS